jgi:hypothetical protein
VSDEDDGGQISYEVLRRGTPVVAADGLQVGTVHQVLDNVREHIFDGIVVDTPEGRRFVDAPEVARIAVRRVTLTIDGAQVRELPEHRGPGGALQDGLRRRVARWRRRLPGGDP